MIVHVSGGYIFALKFTSCSLSLYFLELLTSHEVTELADIYGVVRLLGPTFVLDTTRTQPVQCPAAFWRCIGQVGINCVPVKLSQCSSPCAKRGTKVPSVSTLEFGLSQVTSSAEFWFLRIFFTTNTHIKFKFTTDLWACRRRKLYKSRDRAPLVMVSVLQGCFMILVSPPLNVYVVIMTSLSGSLDELLSGLVICDLDWSRISKWF